MIISRIITRNLRSLPGAKILKCPSPEVLNNYYQPQYHLCAAFSSKTNINLNTPGTLTNPETGEVKKKKSPIVPKITLLLGDELTVTTLEEAQKLAKRRDLKLVKVSDVDSKTQRAVYRLLTGAEYLQEYFGHRGKKPVQKRKGEKFLSVSQNISEHDLQTDVNKIVKWLAKRYEVVVVINGSTENFAKAESVFSFLEKHLSPYGQVVQKRRKGSDVRFQLIPPEEPSSSGDNERKDKAPDKAAL